MGVQVEMPEVGYGAPGERYADPGIGDSVQPAAERPLGGEGLGAESGPLDG
jgi:hypothetical protein